MRCTRGQASVEYLGIVGLIALVLGALAAPALAGQDITGGVVAQVRRALCIVSHGDCAQDRAPCAVDTNAVREGQHVNLLVVRLGRDRLTLRETRSDGSVAVTSIKEHEAGVEVGRGADLRFGSFSKGDSVRGAILARFGS